MTTNILHISDTHLGNLQYRNHERQQDYADAFDEAVRLATDDLSTYKFDAVLHTGDLFHAPNPNVPIVNQCLDTLERLNDAGIPFLGIVGNHERKRDEQWLDLVRRFDLVDRLDRTPTYVGEGDDRVALYGIDAVRRPEWKSADFEIEPPENDEYVLLAMHELLSPPVPEHMAHHEAEDVLDRTSIHIDGLALGDYHKPERTSLNGTDIWYPGSTEKTARDENEDHYVNHLAFDDGELTIHKLRLDSPREFIEFDIEFAESDGLAQADVVEVTLSNFPIDEHSHMDVSVATSVLLDNRAVFPILIIESVSYGMVYATAPVRTPGGDDIAQVIGRTAPTTVRVS